jgi:hypothetical protein
LVARIMFEKFSVNLDGWSQSKTKVFTPAGAEFIVGISKLKFRPAWTSRNSRIIARWNCRAAQNRPPPIRRGGSWSGFAMIRINADGSKTIVVNLTFHETTSLTINAYESS